MEDPQKVLEIEYLNSIEKDRSMGVRDILHRFHIEDEKERVDSAITTVAQSKKRYTFAANCWASCPDESYLG